MENRPRGREKNVTGQGKTVHKRGDGLGTGPVGSSSGYQGRTDSGSAQSSSGKRAVTRSGGIKPILLIVLAVLIFGGGGAGLSGLFGGGSSTTQQQTYVQPQQSYVQPQQSYVQPQQSYTQQQTQASAIPSFDISSLLGGFSGGTVSSGWQRTSNVGQLDTGVVSGARAKRTKVLGNGKDTVTIMVYMCGTDLESKNGMGTADLQEMLNATISSKVNLLVFTGGCKSWRNNVVSSKVNQIYKVESGGLKCLVSDAGTAAMTNPDNLAAYIKWCAQNYPANRNALIFWDHGGGSLSGYGYDEKYGSGSMNLKGINDALSAGGVTFDFIGFDACLMATTETALTLTPYADYLIASEETEPGVGWYYTNWLTKLSGNTSLSTLEIGKSIVDDFVDVCAQKCPGQQTTLAVIDLAELEKTVPSELKDFAASASKLLQNQQYQVVSNARSGAREFASSSKIDQVDLVHLADNLGTTEGRELANALLGAIKYNRTSSNMTNAYGLSIYFPYKKVSQVNTAVKTYESIGMDSDYLRCIQQFASIETGGQAVSGGAASPLSSLLGAYSGGSSSASSGASADMISQVLSGLLGGGLGNVSGLTSSNSGFLGKSLDVESTTQFISDNYFDPNSLVWLLDSSGGYELRMTEDQWKLVQDLELNVFFDDGEGYIDLGLDNVFDFTDEGALVGEYDGTWLAINDQPVAYYHTSTFDDGDNYYITGRVPVMLNDQRAELILVFDNDHPYGYVAGACADYRNGETDTIAKAATELQQGDKIDFLCDYYGYDGSYQDSYYLGDPMAVDGELTISNVYIDADAASATYRFTDIYQQQYWTPAIP